MSKGEGGEKRERKKREGKWENTGLEEILESLKKKDELADERRVNYLLQYIGTPSFFPTHSLSLSLYYSFSLLSYP